MKKIGIFVGSFNPFTTGHYNILEQAENIFGKENVIIAIGINPAKNLLNESLLTKQIDIAQTLKQQLPSRTIEAFTEDLLTEFIWNKEKEGFNVTLIRGLRNETDFQHELNFLRYMQDFKPDIKVVYLICDREYSHISSSGYRDIEKSKKGAGHKYLAKEDNG